MSDDISVRLSSPPVDPGCATGLAARPDADGASAALRPWRRALAELLSGHGDVEARRVETALDADAADFDDPCGDIDHYERAAHIALDICDSDDTAAAPSALARALLWLKRRGFEVGRSPADRWRHHRLLNAGDRALDALIEDLSLRRCAISTLFFRLVRRAMERGSLHEQGLSSEIICELPWTGGGQRPWRHRLPPRKSPGDGWTETIVDWLLEQLLARGLMSVTLESVIEERDADRVYAVDDALGRWMKGLPGDEGRFVAGAVYTPARLGGWPRSRPTRVDDAAATAGHISDDFVPDDTRRDSYERHLRRVDSLRRIPEALSPTCEFRDSHSTWEGRFTAVIHPARRTAGGDHAYVTVEAGMVFEQPHPEWSTWSGRQKNALRSELLSIVRGVDDEVFESFGSLLDEVVDCIHRRPEALRSGQSDPGGQPSPLWRDFDEGYGELRDALATNDADALAGGLRRWTFPVSARTEG